MMFNPDNFQHLDYLSFLSVLRTRTLEVKIRKNPKDKYTLLGHNGYPTLYKEDCLAIYVDVKKEDRSFDRRIDLISNPKIVTGSIERIRDKDEKYDDPASYKYLALTGKPVPFYLPVSKTDLTWLKETLKQVKASGVASYSEDAERLYVAYLYWHNFTCHFLSLFFPERFKKKSPDTIFNYLLYMTWHYGRLPMSYRAYEVVDSIQKELFPFMSFDQTQTALYHTWKSLKYLVHGTMSAFHDNFEHPLGSTVFLYELLNNVK